jgi:hypothetical protein
MKLSLSARLIEVTKEKFALDVDEFLDLAKRTGYEGVHLRDGQIDPLLREGRFDEVEAFYVEVRAYGRGCPIRCPLYEGEARYGKGVTPVADRTVPRVAVMPSDVYTPNKTEEYAEKIHAGLKALL